MDNDYLKINQKLWNAKTEVHINSKFYDVEDFKKGKSSLNPIETGLLKNIRDLKILHLQCHFGLDSMSLSRLGANVTAVDLSDESIKAANKIKNELKLNTRFIQSDVYTLKEKLNEKFDIVYTSYGVLGWLPDMQKWADIVSHFLKPHGKLVLIEFHPVVWMFSNDFSDIEYPYSDKQPIIENIEGTYTDKEAKISNNSISWNHGLANVIKALLEHDLEIKQFDEYNYSPYDCFQNTIEIDQGKYQINGLENKIPMLYSIVAQKKSKDS